MATKPLKTVGKKKQPAAVQTSSSIEEKIKDFLKAGGEIEQVRSGVSGQPSMAPPKPKPSESKTSEPKPSEPKPSEPETSEPETSEPKPSGSKDSS